MWLVHYASKETGRPHCGNEEPAVHVVRQASEVTCPACIRILADDARRTVPKGNESED
jgi:hypothetical protein